MIIVKYDDNAVVDKKLITHKQLSHGAFRLYSILLSYVDGAMVSPEDLQLKLWVSANTYAKWIKNLKHIGLIDIVKIDMRTYMLFIGSLDINANEVRNHWEKLDNE